jgi:ribosomal protein S12 methylthiotransferase accessory factor
MRKLEILPKAYTRGTHRCREPEETLRWIEPRLRWVGVTRCADVTGLDRIGIPVYCSIRPRNRTIQVSNGKGLRAVDAKVSALMEAIELFHAENLNTPCQRASLRSLRAAGRAVIEPRRLPDFRRQNFFSADFLIDWVRAESLTSEQEVWLPASAAYLCTPMLYNWSTNGLASGNHLVEATLHAIYEVIERDAVARLRRKGRIYFTRDQCRFIDLKTVPEGPVRELADKLARAEIKLVLIRLKSCIPVHSFMAVILDRNSAGYCSRVNLGEGTHLSTTVAATRAITEAAQSRLTYIHGARDDLPAGAYEGPHDRVYDVFKQIVGRASWRSLTEMAGADLLQDYAYVLGCLRRVGYTNVFRINMTQPPCDIPVVKVIIPGLENA